MLASLSLKIHRPGMVRRARSSLESVSRPRKSGQMYFSVRESSACLKRGTACWSESLGVLAVDVFLTHLADRAAPQDEERRAFRACRGQRRDPAGLADTRQSERHTLEPGMTGERVQGRDCIVSQKRDVLFTDALLAFVHATGFPGAALVVHQRGNSLAGELPRQTQIPGLLAGSVDEHHGRMNLPLSRKRQRPRKFHAMTDESTSLIARVIAGGLRCR